jgi:hypothetical protein
MLEQHTTITILRILIGIITLPVYTVLHGMLISLCHGVENMVGLPFVDLLDLVAEILVANV